MILELQFSAAMGISAAFNTALDYANAPFVTRCDADDLYPSDRLAKQLDWMAKNGGEVCVSSRSRNRLKWEHS